MPASRMLRSAVFVSPSSCRVISIAPPAGLYLIALPRRLESTCSMRRGSTSTTRYSEEVSSERRCRSVDIWKRVSTRLANATRSVGSRWKVNCPACKRVTSSRSSVSSIRRDVDWSMSCSDSTCQSASSGPLPRAVWMSSVCAKPFKIARGVRSSCAAMPRKASFRCSASLSAVTSWWTTSAARSRSRGAWLAAFDDSMFRLCASSATAFDPMMWFRTRGGNGTTHSVELDERFAKVVPSECRMTSWC